MVSVLSYCHVLKQDFVSQLTLNQRSPTGGVSEPIFFSLSQSRDPRNKKRCVGEGSRGELPTKPQPNQNKSWTHLWVKTHQLRNSALNGRQEGCRYQGALWVMRDILGGG